jgi:hypothetical protein
MTTSKIIEQTLRDNPGTRNSDRKLILEVWRRQGFELTAYQEEMFWRVGSAESIRRTRQKLQEKGLFLATEPIQKERARRGLKTRAIIVNVEPERLPQIFDDSYYERS